MLVNQTKYPLALLIILAEQRETKQKIRLLALARNVFDTRHQETL